MLTLAGSTCFHADPGIGRVDGYVCVVVYWIRVGQHAQTRFQQPTILSCWADELEMREWKNKLIQAIQKRQLPTTME